MSEPLFRAMLPSPPSTNALFTTRRGSRQRIKTDAYRAWITDAGWALAGVKHLCPTGTIQGCVGLRIEMPFNRKRDISNGIKAIEDLLVSHAIIPDDRWVDELDVRRVPVTEPLTVSIWRIGDSIESPTA